MHQPGIEPGAPAWQAGIVKKTMEEVLDEEVSNINVTHMRTRILPGIRCSKKSDC